MAGQYALAILFFIGGLTCAMVIMVRFPRKACGILLFGVSMVSIALWIDLVIKNQSMLIAWRWVLSVAEGFVAVALAEARVHLAEDPPLGNSKE